MPVRGCSISRSRPIAAAIASRTTAAVAGSLIVGGVVSVAERVTTGSRSSGTPSARAVPRATRSMPSSSRVADLGPVGAHRQLELDPLGDDVALHAAMDRADADHRALERIDVAADHRLERDDDLGGDQHRIDAQMRIGAVRADAVDEDRDRIGAAN